MLYAGEEGENIPSAAQAIQTKEITSNPSISNPRRLTDEQLVCLATSFARK
jgi:hypothetical protein